MSNAPIELVFLGTASQSPSLTRNVSCAALRFTGSGGVWLFDVGEATQHQILRCPSVRLSKVEAVFITHLHGDHLFGLPGLLCTTSASAGEDASRCVTVVGPAGVSAYLSASLALSCSFLAYRLRVIELVDALPLSPAATAAAATACAVDPTSGASVGVGADGLPRQFALNFTVEYVCAVDGVWDIPTMSKDACVRASGLVHSTPCVGYVLQEPDVPGGVNISRVKPILDANAEALRAQGVRNPAVLLGKLKKGEAVTLPDGTILDPSDITVLLPTRRGRRVCVLGDTCDSARMLPICTDCDVLVHEATNACVGPEDGTVAEVNAKTFEHGHSTPQMAGAFARVARARSLVLTHFSARYKGDTTASSTAVMSAIADMARGCMVGDVTDAPSAPAGAGAASPGAGAPGAGGLSAAGAGGDTTGACPQPFVVCARDFMVLSLSVDGLLSEVSASAVASLSSPPVLGVA